MKTPFAEKASPTIAQIHAAWISGLAFEHLPEEVVIRTKDCIRDTLANAFLGSIQERSRPFEFIVKRNSSQEGVVVIGQPWKAAAADAAFINAIYAGCCELDDVFAGAGGHPGAVVVPVALALAQQFGLSGRQLITAVVAGYDVMHRTTYPIYPDTQRRGFQSTGIAGPFGATASAAKLLGLTAEQSAQAFGVVGSFCGGLMEYDQSGGESKRLFTGIAARSGIEAAQLASCGVTGPLTIFEGKRGVFRAFADKCEIDRATAGLGSDFRIVTRRKMKLYPSVGSIQGAIEAMLALRELLPTESQIDRVIVQVPAAAVSHGGSVQLPHDLLTAEFSFAFALALAIHFGRNDLALYEDPSVRENVEITALCKKVEVEESKEDNFPMGSATVIVELTDGSSLTRTQNPPSGAPESPLSAEQLEARFRDLSHTAISVDSQDKLLEKIDHLEKLESLDEIYRLTAS